MTRSVPRRFRGETPAWAWLLGIGRSPVARMLLRSGPGRRLRHLPVVDAAARWAIVGDVALAVRRTASLDRAMSHDAPPPPVHDRVPFLVLATARTGSTLLATELDRRWPEIRCLGEELAPANRGDEPVARVVDRVFDADPERPIVGCKLFYSHLSREDFATILRMDGIRVVHLRRRNHLRRYVSSQIARRTSVWVLGGPGAPPTIEDRAVRIDAEQFLRSVRYTLRTFHPLGAMLAETQVPVIDVWYEDLSRDIDGEVHRVATFLGATDEPLSDAPRLRRQNPEPLAVLVRNYDEVRRALIRTPMRAYLDPDDVRRGRRTRTCWPTERQELAVHAALAPSDEAGDAYLRWSNVTGATSVAELDVGSQRLMPMVYRNLRRADVQTTLEADLRRSYVDASARNQRLLHVLEGVLADLDRAAVPTLVLKGAALTVLHYQDRGTRPMADLDVLVPPDRAEAALAALRAEGWGFAGRRSDGPIGPLLDVRHAVALERDDFQLDLHWYTSAESVGTDLDDQLWSASVELTIGSRSTRALCPADQLLHAFVHGLRYNPVPPVRWIADAYVVITSSGDALDWDRLTSLATRYGLVAPVSAALGYLDRQFPGLVPPPVLTGIRSRPIPRRERRAFQHATRAHWVLGSGGAMWRHHRRRAPDQSPVRAVVGFADNLRVLYDLDRVRDLPRRLWDGVRQRRHRDREPR